MTGIDILGIGNAIVDIVARAGDGFLARQGMTKGGTALIDEARADALCAKMSAGQHSASGSVANSIAAIAAFGGRTAFIGKVKDDAVGHVFAQDLRSTGVVFNTSPAQEGPATARRLTLVTPDARRTTSTHLGACLELTSEDIDPALVADSAILYLEGSLFDPPHARAAFRKAATIARKAGRMVALNLSDRGCVNRHLGEVQQLITDHVDILIANEGEFSELCGHDDLAAIADDLADHVGIAAITRGARGSLIVSGARRIEIPAAPVTRLLDTTGAGDLYAAGLLHGLSTGRSPGESGWLGSLAAAEVIGHYGARPQTRLADPARERAA